MLARQLINQLFEGPQDYSRYHQVSPEYQRDIRGRASEFLRSLGRAPDQRDLAKLSKMLVLNYQDTEQLVRQIMTRPRERSVRAMVPESTK